MSFVYIASPYSSPTDDEEGRALREARYVAARAFLAHALNDRVWAYSPIVHCHHVALHHKMPTDAKFWWEMNKVYLDRATAVYVLAINGWNESKGIKMEVEYANERGIPIGLFFPPDYTWRDFAWPH
jgi:hypothetical protein